MADKVLITMDDLEVAVQSNAAFEAAGTETILVSSLDDSKAVLRRSDPDVVVLTNALHEHRVEVLVALARDREISTLGLIEATTPDAAGLVRRLGLTAWMRKPAEPREIVATAIEQIAPVASTVLVEGESGTGKELVAQAIHSLSPRRDKPFIAVNCAALTETLLESELFGHEKGAFTGAAERRLGRFELADGGTIFLDEVGAMPGATQVKLLRVLETRAFFRVGGSQPIRVNVRVVAASNQSLKELVAMGKFREDLFFRLNVLYMYLPPLRERKSDIPLLVKQFVKELSVAHGRSFRGMTDGAMEILVNAHWPGNARQLRNLIESMVVLAPGKEIHASDIPPEIREGGTRLLPVPVPGATRDVQGQELEFILRSLVELKLQIEDLRRRLDESPQRVEVSEMAWPQVTEYEDITPGRERPSRGEHDERESAVVYRPGMKMAEVERATIEAALRVTEGNRRRAAEELGIGERTLYRKIKEYNLT
jgi:DNA-binding NtrC family response regulator